MREKTPIAILIVITIYILYIYKYFLWKRIKLIKITNKVVSWCSWLSRQSNTLKVSGSSPGDAMFLILFCFSLFINFPETSRLIFFIDVLKYFCFFLLFIIWKINIFFSYFNTNLNLFPITNTWYFNFCFHIFDQFKYFLILENYFKKINYLQRIYNSYGSKNKRKGNLIFISSLFLTI